MQGVVGAQGLVAQPRTASQIGPVRGRWPRPGGALPNSIRAVWSRTAAEVATGSNSGRPVG
jgi:hypothetical protein